MAETLTLTLISEFPTLPTFFFSFCLIYLLGYFAVFRRWSPDQRPDATSCFISLFHGSAAAFLAAAALRTAVPSFAAANTPFQNLVLDFSIAYFTVDLLHLTVFPNGRYLFIAHHIATLFVFVTCRYLAGHGAFALLVLLVLAELTSFCQNVWTLAGIRRKDLPLAARIYRAVSPPFYTLYTLMRVIFGPLFFFKMSAFYLNGQAADVIPTWVSLSWIIVVGGAIAVSILWIWHRWVELFAEMKQSQGEEKKDR